MNPLFWAQWRKEKRSPKLVLLFCGLSILATLIFGLGTDNNIQIGVFPAPGTEPSTVDDWIERLNEGDAIDFYRQDEQRAREMVREGRADAALQLMEEDYRLVVATESPNAQLVEQHVQTVFAQELQLRAAAELADDPGAFRDRVASGLEKPPLAITLQASDGSELVGYDMGLQLLYTFTLFLVMFTIGYKINSITAEKVSGIWNRVILSPMRKTEMYLGHLLYTSMIGFVQVLAVFLLFRYVFDFALGGRLGMIILISALYVLVIVAFSMLITSMLRTPEQFNVVFPSFVPIMPLLSGAYMPPGTITNEVLLGISEIIPLKHALDALISVSLYDAGWAEVLLPVGKLCLIGVICMGIGINLMERRTI